MFFLEGAENGLNTLDCGASFPVEGCDCGQEVKKELETGSVADEAPRVVEGLPKMDSGEDVLSFRKKAGRGGSGGGVGSLTDVGVLCFCLFPGQKPLTPAIETFCSTLHISG